MTAYNCAESGHLLGSINPVENTRKCNICDAIVPAMGTFAVATMNGILEKYPVGLFTGCEGGQIRRFLNVQKGDVVLHNWHDGCLYVFRTDKKVEI